MSATTYCPEQIGHRLIASVYRCGSAALFHWLGTPSPSSVACGIAEARTQRWPSPFLIPLESPWDSKTVQKPAHGCQRPGRQLWLGGKTAGDVRRAAEELRHCPVRVQERCQRDGFRVLFRSRSNLEQAVGEEAQQQRWGSVWEGRCSPQGTAVWVSKAGLCLKEDACGSVDGI